MSFLPNIKIPVRSLGSERTNGVEISKKLVDSARTDVQTVLQQLNTSPNGLNQADVESRLEQYGPNEVAREKRRTWLLRLWDNVRNPLVILLVILGIISYATGDTPASIIIIAMVILGIVLRCHSHPGWPAKRNNFKGIGPR